MSDSTEEEVVLPKPPKFNLPVILRARTILYDILSTCSASVAEGNNFLATARRVSESLGLDFTCNRVVEDSLRCMLGRTLNMPECLALAWRIAANVNRLKTGRSVLPWTRQSVEEWVPVEVVGTRYHIQVRNGEKHGRPGRAFKFQILAGSSAGMLVSQFWPNSRTDVAAYHIGFKRRPPYIKLDSSELMSFRFLALIDPRLSDRGPSFFHTLCPPGMISYNQQLIRMRRRVNFACPNDYDHQCSECPVGVDQCESAVHPETFEARECPSCGRLAWFDPDKNYINDFCISCQPFKSAGLPVPLKVLSGES